MSNILYKEEAFAIVGACMEVHRELGMGFSEIIYKDALEVEFKLRGIPYQREAPLPVFYKGEKLRTFNADFVVYEKIILEAKAVSEIIEDHEKQTLNYLACAKMRLGLIINFGSASLQQKRLIK
jgi:GxxExxY protein